MRHKIDILKTPIAEESERLDAELGETGSSGKLFPDGFSASNATGHIQQIQIAAD